MNSFNSTLVQLKEGADTNGDVYNNRFNSTLVQLKVFYFSLISFHFSVSILP